MFHHWAFIWLSTVESAAVSRGRVYCCFPILMLVMLLFLQSNPLLLERQRYQANVSFSYSQASNKPKCFSQCTGELHVTLLKDVFTAMLTWVTRFEPRGWLRLDVNGWNAKAHYSVTTGLHVHRCCAHPSKAVRFLGVYIVFLVLEIAELLSDSFPVNHELVLLSWELGKKLQENLEGPSAFRWVHLCPQGKVWLSAQLQAVPVPQDGPTSQFKSTIVFKYTCCVSGNELEEGHHLGKSPH